MISSKLLLFNILLPWQKLVHLLAILSIFGVLVAADAFDEVGAGREEDD